MTANKDTGSPTVTSEELLRRAADMVPTLKSRAPYTEALRRIPNISTSQSYRKKITPGGSNCRIGSEITWAHGASC